MDRQADAGGRPGVKPGWIALYGEEVLRDEDLPNCCRRSAPENGTGEAFDCPGCGAAWKRVVPVDGPLGWGERILPGRHEEARESEAHIAAWFLHAPNAHPVWDRYILSLIHLRDVPGFPPANKEREDDTHEVVLMPLDPERSPRVEDLGSMVAMTPPNVAVQFRSGSDEEAMEVTETVAWALVRGTLPVEPVGIRGAVEGWKHMVRMYATGARVLNEHDRKRRYR